MRTDPDHLPERQQRELERIRDVLLEEFDKAIARATQPHKRNGKVYRIVLFGSYARDDWVDEPENGYQSDFDLLVIVSHEDLTDIAEYWYLAEDRIARDPAIDRPVNLIVHSLDEVNRSLARGDSAGSCHWIRSSRASCGARDGRVAKAASPRVHAPRRCCVAESPRCCCSAS